MSKLGTAFRLLVRPKALIRVIREKASRKNAVPKPLIQKIANVQSMYPADTDVRVLFATSCVGLPGTLASTNYFLSWLVGLRKNNIDARIVAIFQNEQPQHNKQILFSDVVYYPDINGKNGISYLEAICTKFLPEVIVTHGSPFGISKERANVAHSNGARIILFGGESPEVQIADPEEREYFVRTVVGGYDGVIVMTQNIANYWVGQGFDQEKIFMATSIVDTEMIDLIHPCKVEYCATYFGNLAYEEVFDLIDIAGLASQENKNFRLDIFGDAHDAQKRKFQQEIDGRGYSEVVKLHESVDYDQMVGIQKASKMLLFPGRNWKRANAGFPNKLGEYLASGTPVVASNVGGIYGLFEDNRELYLVEPGDNKSFALKCLECLSQQEASWLIGENGRTWSKENIDAKKVAKAFIHKLGLK